MAERARSFVRLGSRDAVARLQSPFALEELSALSGVAALVVDLASPPDAGALDAGEVERAVQRLRLLPCPSIGVRAGAAVASSETAAAAGAHAGRASTGGLARSSPPPADALQAAVDVLVGSEDELGLLLDTVCRRPIASMALVQLLRHGEALDVDEALVAESLVYSTLQSGSEFRSWLDARPPAHLAATSRDPAVILERDGARLDVVLNRPERHNAYSVEMRDALVEALALAVADASIERIVMRGRGPSFCAGGDLTEFGTLPDPATAHAVRSTRNAARLLAQCATRVCAEVHGACIGAGVELPAFAGRVVARSDAFFQLPELGMGLVPGAGGTASLPRRIGRQRTAYLALSGERIDARTALCWGLIDEMLSEPSHA